MEPTSSNGNGNAAREMFDTMRQVVARLEAEVQRQQDEIKQLRAERDEYRKMLVEQIKDAFGGPEQWADFDPNDYSLTIDDLLEVIRSR